MRPCCVAAWVINFVARLDNRITRLANLVNVLIERHARDRRYVYRATRFSVIRARVLLTKRVVWPAVARSNPSVGEQLLYGAHTVTARPERFPTRVASGLLQAESLLVLAGVWVPVVGSARQREAHFAGMC